MELNFTTRGLVKKTESTYIKNWEELYKMLERDTKQKQYKLRKKYEGCLHEVTFTSKGRTYTYLVATQELANNKVESDLQKIARGEEIVNVQTSNEKGRQLRTAMLAKRTYAILADMVEYQFDGQYLLVDGQLVDMETGEVKVSYSYIQTSVKEFANLGATAEEIAFSILVDIKCKITKIVVTVKCGFVDGELNLTVAFLFQNILNETIAEAKMNYTIKETLCYPKRNAIYICMKGMIPEQIKLNYDGGLIMRKSNVKYNKNGIKVEQRHDVSSWSSDYMDAKIQIDSCYDPFERLEMERDRIVHESRLEAVRSVLPLIVGEDNYIKYYLHQIERINSATIAEHFGVTEGAIRKTSHTVKKKIEAFTKQIETMDGINSRLSGLTFDLRQKDNKGADRPKGEYFADEPDWDDEESVKRYFEKSTKEYFINQQAVKKGVPCRSMDFDKDGGQLDEDLYI